MTLAPGSFRAKAASGGLGYTKDGKPQVAIELQILDEGFAGESITWFGYFTEGTEERTLESLRILGWKTDDLSNLDGMTDNEVKIVVEEDDYNGKTSLKVRWINKIGGLALKAPMTPQQAKAFAAQMKGKAVASRTSGGSSPPAGRTQAKPTPGRQSATTGRQQQGTPEQYLDDGRPDDAF